MICDSRMTACSAARGVAAFACALSVTALVCLLAGPAGADPNDLDCGVFFTHELSPIIYCSDPPSGGWCGEYVPISTREEVDASLRYIELGTIWFVLAAWEVEGKLWAGTEFGIGAYNTAAYGFAECGVCAPAGYLEIPTPGWPGPYEGTAFVTTGTPWSGNFVPVYYFAGYSYYGTGLSTEIPLDVDPPTGFCGMSNTQNPPASYAVDIDSRGRMGVNSDGYVPEWPTCPQDWACCMPDPLGACEMMLEGECMAAGGLWMGEGVTCDPNPCPQPGACCLTASVPGACELMMRETCELIQGTFHGAGTVCDPNPCEAVCCYGPTGGECVITTQANCEALYHGVWHPSYPTCDPTPCFPSPSGGVSWGNIKAMYR